MVTTVLSKGLVFRLTILCKAVIKWAETKTASIVPCGAAPWPPIPFIVISKKSAAAKIGPSFTPTSPYGW